MCLMRLVSVSSGREATSQQHNSSRLGHRFVNCYHVILICAFVVVTTYDSESDHPGLNPEWGPIHIL